MLFTKIIFSLRCGMTVW